MKLENILIVYTESRRLAEKRTLKLVQEVVKKNKIKYSIQIREKLNKNLFKGKDLVLVVGGDGTFLMAAHHVLDKIPLMGINSDPSCKEGFFMISDIQDFERKFDKVIKGKFKIKELHTLEAFIGKKKIPELALNEYYVASEKPYHTARYYLTIKGVRERQKSSGVLISTAAGSYAWVKSAGGKELPLESDKFEYLIREPYCGRTAAKCSLVNGILNRNEKLVIEFEMGNGIVIADSIANEFKFKSKQKVTIKISDKKIYVVSV